MSTHAPCAPSSAARIVACPGSRKMEALYPQEETIDTREGDATHWGGAELLRGDQIAVGQVAPNGVVLNVEMVEAAEMYAEHIIKRDGENYGWLTPLVEQPITVTPLHPSNYGTPDYRLYIADTNHLYIDDFKYGRGLVPEVRNWQLMNYAALAAAELGVFDEDALKVTMTIHQPRCYHRRGPVRSWTATLGEMRPYFAKMTAAFTMAMQDDAPVIAHPDACRDCTARHNCEAAIQDGQEAMDVGYDSVPLIMSPAALSKEYKRLKAAEKMIKARREGIEQSIVSTIQRGKPVPFFSLARTPGRVVWLDESIREVANAMNVKIDKPGLITPLQAIKAGLPEDVMKAYSHAPGGAVELVEDDGTLAASVFNKEQ